MVSLGIKRLLKQSLPWRFAGTLVASSLDLDGAGDAIVTHWASYPAVDRGALFTLVVEGWALLLVLKA